MLKLECLPEETKKVFDFLYKNESLKKSNATLMGGTALTLLIGHRLSEDLDFFYFKEEMPSQEIKIVLANLKDAGFSVLNIMDQARISQARINGINLENYIQEYAINGVKISFCAMSKGGISRRAYFSSSIPMNHDGAFNIPSLNTLFESKSVVLMDRVKSRDLFDLMTLITQHNFTIENILDAIVRIDNRDINEAQSAIEVLVGNVPIDKDDPGFESIDLNVSIEDVYDILKEKVNEYEQSLSLESVGLR